MSRKLTLVTYLKSCTRSWAKVSPAPFLTVFPLLWEHVHHTRQQLPQPRPTTCKGTFIFMLPNVNISDLPQILHALVSLGLACTFSWQYFRYSENTYITQGYIYPNHDQQPARVHLFSCYQMSRKLTLVTYLKSCTRSWAKVSPAPFLTVFPLLWEHVHHTRQHLPQPRPTTCKGTFIFMLPGV